MTFEASGRTTLFDSRYFATGESCDPSMLGVVSAHGFESQHAGTIDLIPEVPLHQTGGFVLHTGAPLVLWLEKWIEDPVRADNVRKLRNSGADERHLVVIVAAYGDVPFEVTDLLTRSYGPLPAQRPTLPPEITHVWVMSTWSLGDGIRWSPRGGWERFDKMIGTWLAAS